MWEVGVGKNTKIAFREQCIESRGRVVEACGCAEGRLGSIGFFGFWNGTKNISVDEIH